MAQLAAPPADDWITNGGSLLNQRYSPLADITTKNVSSLKGVWLTHLRNSAVAAKYSAESQPLEYKGVIYVPTGADDVFAVSVATGRILWQYKANLDRTISTACCGWESRGVALGDGKVYIGQLDGQLVALDQMTGRRVWSTQVADWRRVTPSRARRCTWQAACHGALGRRVRHPRARDRVRRAHRQGGVALLHDSRSRAEGT